MTTRDRVKMLAVSDQAETNLKEYMIDHPDCFLAVTHVLGGGDPDEILAKIRTGPPGLTAYVASLARYGLIKFLMTEGT